MNGKEQMLKARKVKEQFNQAHEERNWKDKTYSDYKAKKIVFDVVEFGRTFDISSSADQTAIAVAYHMAVEDFFKEKAISFPTWDGLPEIKINKRVDYLVTVQGKKQIGWYVQVPKKYVLTEEQKLQKLDEDLWNS